MAAFGVAEAQIISLFMEAIAYGTYLTTLAMCGRIQTARKPQSSVGRSGYKVVAVMCVMAVIATLDLVLGLQHNVDAFVDFKGPGGPAAKFDEISQWVNVMKTVDTQTMSLLGDAVLIYRCYIVSSNRWIVVALPILMWLAGMSCSVMIVFITATLHEDTTISQQAMLKPFLISFFVITICLNFFTTGIIVWRIWSVDKETGPYVARRTLHRVPRTNLGQTMRIIIESGMLYTLFVIFTFVCELAESNLIYGASCMMIQAAGISFNLTLIRIYYAGCNLSTSFIESAPPGSHPLQFIRSSASTCLSSSGDVERVLSCRVNSTKSRPHSLIGISQEHNARSAGTTCVGQDVSSLEATAVEEGPSSFGPTSSSSLAVTGVEQEGNSLVVTRAGQDAGSLATTSVEQGKVWYAV